MQHLSKEEVTDMQHRKRPFPWAVVIAVVSLLLVGVLIAVAVSLSSAATSSTPANPTPQESTNSSDSAFGQPEELDVEDHSELNHYGGDHEGESLAEVTRSCTAAFSEAQVEELLNRALEFEEIRLLPDTAKKQAGIEQFGTPMYIQSNSVYVDPSLENNPTRVEIVREQTVVSCIIADGGTYRVTVVPVIKIYRLESDGSKVYAEGMDTVPAYAASWVFDGALWKINEEVG